jgi:hypothetical protein
MIDLTHERLEGYLREAFGSDAELLDYGDIGSLDKQGIKRFGYGKPLRLRYRAGGEEREAVLSVMKGDKYGHQFYWDRAAILMFQYETGGLMERHVKPLGLGYVDGDDNLVPVRGPREFFILNEKVEGYDYYHDLERIRTQGMQERDLDTAREFSRWMARVHAEKLDDPDLYYRRVRELLGASECIMGLVDEAFPHPYDFFPDERFRALEKRLVDWRWKLRRYAHRLSAVHGDFHPWNVLVQEDGGFMVLDRSRGQWGEPAGDVATMAINYMLFGLMASDEPRLSESFQAIYRAYFDAYLERTGDEELLEVIAPFFVFRALVIASPEWYPDHPPEVRQGLFMFMENVLDEERFDYTCVNKYMGKAC